MRFWILMCQIKGGGFKEYRISIERGVLSYPTEIHIRYSKKASTDFILCCSQVLLYAKENPQIQSKRVVTDSALVPSLPYFFPPGGAPGGPFCPPCPPGGPPGGPFWGPSGPPCPLGGPFLPFLSFGISKSPGPGSPRLSSTLLSSTLIRAIISSASFLECLRFESGHSRVERNQFGVGNAAFLDLFEQCANMSQFFLENTNVFLQLSHFRNEIFRDISRLLTLFQPLTSGDETQDWRVPKCHILIVVGNVRGFE